MTQSPIEKAKEALKDATVYLAAATSSYEHFAGNSQRAGRRDALYGTKLNDYHNALTRAREALKALEGE